MSGKLKRITQNKNELKTKHAFPKKCSTIFPMKNSIRMLLSERCLILCGDEDVGGAATCS